MAPATVVAVREIAISVGETDLGRLDVAQTFPASQRAEDEALVWLNRARASFRSLVAPHGPAFSVTDCPNVAPGPPDAVFRAVYEDAFLAGGPPSGLRPMAGETRVFALQLEVDHNVVLRVPKKAKGKTKQRTEVRSLALSTPGAYAQSQTARRPSAARIALPLAYKAKGGRIGA